MEIVTSYEIGRTLLLCAPILYILIIYKELTYN